MISIDHWQEIYYTIKQNKLRTFLTAFGVFWGILLLILLLGAGKGLEYGAQKNWGSNARNSIVLIARKVGQPYKSTPQGKKVQFLEEDIQLIRSNVDGVEFISGENYTGSRWRREVHIIYKNKSVKFGAYGVTDEYFKIKRHQEYLAGRKLNLLDNKDARKVTVIGTSVSSSLFDSHQAAIGKYINIHGISLRVAGVFYDNGRNGRMSERIYIPLTTFQSTFGEHNLIDVIAVTPTAGTNPFLIEERIVSFLKRRHVISPDDKKAIFVRSNARQAQTFDQMFLAIRAFVWFVGIGTLAAGIVGVSNIMIITVKDRTIEIGIRKALGATPASITTMIISESILVTTFAGYVGLVFGVGIWELVNFVIESNNLELPYFDRPGVDFSTALTALALLVCTGAIAGLAPALRAAKVTPIEAMKDA